MRPKKQTSYISGFCLPKQQKCTRSVLLSKMLPQYDERERERKRKRDSIKGKDVGTEILI